MPARILSSVLLPLPFGPMIPKNSPSLDVEADVVERLLHLVVVRSKRVEEVLLERRPLLVRQPERLRDARDLDRTGRLTRAPRTTAPPA